MSESIFSADSSLMRVLGRGADLVVLNLLFVATSLPLVTLGGSLPALHHTAMRLVRGTCESVREDYWSSFRQNLRPGSLVLLVLVGAAAVMGAWYVVLTAGALDAGLQLVLLAVWFVVALQVALVALFAFPYLARFDDPPRRVLRNARLLAWKHPLTALMVVVCTGLPVVASVYYPHLSVWGLLWVVVGFAAVACLTGILFIRIFDQYAPAAPDRQEADPAHAHR